MTSNTPRPRGLGTPSPTPGEIKKARLMAGYTIREAAICVHVATVTWRNWERPHTGGRDDKTMHPAFAELFSIKAGLNEEYQRKALNEEG